MTERDYMLRAIELAKKGRGFTNPNPMVGAVIVKDGRIIGEGYHERCGELHAERNAIASLTESAEGATLYVTLEPCCHYGKTPPCTEAILDQKIARVVIGSRDPNPLVAGKGAEILRNAGVRVEEDFMRGECDALNPVFFHFITKKVPYVVMKYAMTADGKIAARTGDSKWITGEKAREKVQEMRHAYTGIMVGIGTVLADDPMLNVRIPGKKSPVRIICDSSLRIPMDSGIVKSAKKYRTIVAYAGENAEKLEQLRNAGVETISVPDVHGQVDLKKLMEYLGEQGIDSILLEGGGTLNESALAAGIVNEVCAFIAPKIFGGTDAKTPVAGTGVAHPSEAVMLTLKDTEKIGDDLMLRYQVKISGLRS
jgi:diaminohydroxyphosphoribosylaminopyrimidine deaminase/5-amino-6-(5-phosphoribosylamino)uracil reductase